jgi:8-oxo-dGTP pyrophosphatase MutT (NUDIX family)
MLRRAAKPQKPDGIQYGALPYRMQADAALEVLLITSRETKRWIIPKGWPIDGLAPRKAAAREAYEEAGVRGRVESSLGNYTYVKYSSGRQASHPCEVEVFPLAVKRQSKNWPEARERRAQWCSLAEAASLVSDEGLRDLLQALESRKGTSSGKRG